jgi:hypothetical protein
MINPNYRQGLLCLFVFFIQFNLGFAQIFSGDECTTPDPSPHEMELYFNDLQRIQAFETAGGISEAVTIPIYFTVLRKSDGTIDGSWQLGLPQIINFITNLNNRFADLNYTFSPCGISYIDNDVLYNDHSLGDFLRDYSYSSSPACVYFFPSNNATASGPQIPAPNNTLQFGYVFAANDTHFGPPHEMGHFFSLFHIFGYQTTYLFPPTANPEDQIDHPYNMNFNDGARPRELVIRDTTMGNMFNIPNCSYAGDMVCDTPPDGMSFPEYFPNPNIPNCVDNSPATLCPDSLANQGWIAFDCSYLGNYVDYNTHPIDPLSYNIMSYFGSCTDSFTDGQNTRMDFYYDVRVNEQNQLDPTACVNLTEKVEYWGDPNASLRDVRIKFTHPIDSNFTNALTDMTGKFNAILYEDDVMADVWKFGTGVDFSYTDDDWNPEVYDENNELKRPVTTIDLVLTLRHILLTDTLDGYGQLAADVNNSGHVSTIDYIRISRLILFYDEPFPDLDAPWKFIPEYIPVNYPIEFNENPFTLFGDTTAEYIFPDWQYQITDDLGSNGFHAVFAGDVNQSDVPAFAPSNEPDTRGSKVSSYSNAKIINKGDVFEISIEASAFKDLVGYQFGFFIDQDVLEFLEMEKVNLRGISYDNFGLSRLNKNELRTLWTEESLTPITLKDGDVLFKLKLKALQEISDIEAVFNLDDNILAMEFYDFNLNKKRVDLNLNINNYSSDFEKEVEVKTKILVQPNPFSNHVTIVFDLQHSGNGELSFYNVYGEQISSLKSMFDKGRNSIEIDNLSNIPEGTVIVNIKTEKESISGKMIKIKAKTF